MFGGCVNEQVETVAAWLLAVDLDPMTNRA